MTDEELINQLRQEGYDHFGTTYSDEAADRIEKLLHEITSLNTVIDMLYVAWDQTAEELNELKEKYGELR
jgi:hypothetical protein